MKRRGNQPFSPPAEDADRLLRLFNEGRVTVLGIVQYLQRGGIAVSRPTVTKWLKRHGARMGEKGRPRTEVGADALDWMNELRLRGRTYQQIADDTGYSYGTVHKALNPGKITRDRAAAMLRLKTEGMPLLKIAERFGVQRQAVRGAIDRARKDEAAAAELAAEDAATTGD